MTGKMSRGLFITVTVGMLSLLTRPLSAQENSLDQGLNEVAKQVTESIPVGKTTTIAVMDFNDLSGNVTMLGRFVSEELITKLFQTKRFKVIERSLLEKALDELKFNTTDLVDTGNAKQLGKVVGAEAIVTGTITDLGRSVKVNARVITVESGEIIGAAGAQIANDASVGDMLKKVLSRSSGPGQKSVGKQEATEGINEPEDETAVKKHRYKIMGRIYDADDVVTMYVNGKESILVRWGQGENGTSIGHRPGESGWVDISDYFSKGKNDVRMTVWNNPGCCDVAGAFQVKVDDELIVDRKFRRRDSSQGMKYDEKAQVNLK
jgi:TolB-like protein